MEAESNTYLQLRKSKIARNTAKLVELGLIKPRAVSPDSISSFRAIGSEEAPSTRLAGRTCDVSLDVDKLLARCLGDQMEKTDKMSIIKEFIDDTACNFSLSVAFKLPRRGPITVCRNAVFVWMDTSTDSKVNTSHCEIVDGHLCSWFGAITVGVMDELRKVLKTQWPDTTILLWHRGKTLSRPHKVTPYMCLGQVSVRWRGCLFVLFAAVVSHTEYCVCRSEPGRNMPNQLLLSYGICWTLTSFGRMNRSCP